METITIPLRPVLVFAIVLARVGGLVTFAPFWSLRATPRSIRAMLALALALVITPIAAPMIETPPVETIPLAVVIMGELAIGCALGFISQLALSGLEMAAHVLISQMGFSLSAIIDPTTRAQTTAIGTMAQMCGLVILLAMDGHHWMLAATVRSFETIGPGGFAATHDLIELLLRASASVLAVGVSLAAPALVVLLAVEVALGIAGRVMPQLQVLLLGFPVKIAVGLWLAGASLYFLPGAFRLALQAIRDNLAHTLEAMK